MLSAANMGVGRVVVNEMVYPARMSIFFPFEGVPGRGSAGFSGHEQCYLSEIYLANESVRVDSQPMAQNPLRGLHVVRGMIPGWHSKRTFRCRPRYQDLVGFGQFMLVEPAARFSVAENMHPLGQIISAASSAKATPAGGW